MIQLPVITGNSDWTITKFECTGCGECCNIPVLNTEDVRRIAVNQKLDPFDFIEFRGDLIHPNSRTVKGTSVEGVLVLKQNEERTKCLFLNNENKCDIYEDRPMICQMFPYTPTYIEKKHTYEIEITLSDECEGVGKGSIPNVYNINKIASKWRIHRKNYDFRVRKWNLLPSHLRNLTRFVREMFV